MGMGLWHTVEDRSQDSWGLFAALNTKALLLSPKEAGLQSQLSSFPVLLFPPAHVPAQVSQG